MRKLAKDTRRRLKREFKKDGSQSKVYKDFGTFKLSYKKYLDKLEKDNKVD